MFLIPENMTHTAKSSQNPLHNKIDLNIVEIALANKRIGVSKIHRVFLRFIRLFEFEVWNN